ncbi:Chitin synthase, class 5 [Malassezia sp. CBS 17886]|nr:Chitin synthase, class 5 [Malassezia sp. CBS 17886]
MASHYVHQVAPTHMHSPQRAAKGQVSYTFTVGKLDAGMAILIGERASLIEFPALLLPPGVSHGSVVDVCVTRNEAAEQERREVFVSLQDDILQMYGVNAPKPPVLRLRNVTQTTVSLEWDPLELATANLFSLDILRNGERIAKIPRPLSTTSTKLSGLDVATDYTIQLVMYTSTGTFPSEELRTKTHTIHDMSGIHACLGAIADERLLNETKAILTRLGARWTDQIVIDTTHLICTEAPTVRGRADEFSRMYAKAQQLSIPIVQPHWLFACEDEQRYAPRSAMTDGSMVNISNFYIDTMPGNAMRVNERLGASERAGDAESTRLAGDGGGQKAAPEDSAAGGPEKPHYVAEESAAEHSAAEHSTTEEGAGERATERSTAHDSAVEHDAERDLPAPPADDDSHAEDAQAVVDSGIDSGMENVDLNDSPWDAA